MVHFGRYLQTHRIPGWEDYYIAYKLLKRRIRLDLQRVRNSEGLRDEERQEILKLFSELLDSQIEKIVLFMMEREGLLAESLQRLRKKREDAVPDVIYEADESGFIAQPSTPVVVHWQMMDEYRHIGMDLLQLLFFVELNVTGLRKILKKFDKQVGFRLWHQYIASRSYHPFSQLQQLFRTEGLGAMVATISRNLAELRNESLEIRSSTSSAIISSMFRNAALPAEITEEEPILQRILEVMHRLTQEVSMQTFLANELLLPAPTEKTCGATQEEAHFMSIQINLFNTFLYMVNYYIVVPSSDDYAKLLNAPATLCGVIIGSMPLAALVSALVYSWWSNFSYTAPLVVSTLVLMMGNLFYAVALYFDSIWLLLLGRFLCGLGGARAINRRYLCDHVPVQQLTKASAAFISASALGMAAGPAIAGLLSRIDFKICGELPVNLVTAPGWLMCVSWGLYLLLILLFFKEPDRPSPIILSRRRSSNRSAEAIANNSADTATSSNSAFQAPLLPGNGHHGSASRRVPAVQRVHPFDDEEEDPRESATEVDEWDSYDDKAVETVRELSKELTEPVKILLWIYFMLKFASELLISESSILTDHYFDWKTPQVAIFLSMLGLTVLPGSAVVGNWISNIHDDRVVVVWAQVTTGLGVVGILCYAPLLEYSAYQYGVAAVVIFVSTNVLEGVNMSLLSKVMSPRLSRGVFNCGLLSTEVGTLARAMADALITLVGRRGVEHLLNLTMLPTLALVTATTAYTGLGYYTLY